MVCVGGKPGNFPVTGSDLPSHWFVWKLKGNGNGEGREREKGRVGETTCLRPTSPHWLLPQIPPYRQSASLSTVAWPPILWQIYAAVCLKCISAWNSSKRIESVFTKYCEVRRHCVATIFKVAGLVIRRTIRGKKIARFYQIRCVAPHCRPGVVDIVDSRDVNKTIPCMVLCPTFMAMTSA